MLKALFFKNFFYPFVAILFAIFMVKGDKAYAMDFQDSADGMSQLIVQRFLKAYEDSEVKKDNVSSTASHNASENEKDLEILKKCILDIDVTAIPIDNSMDSFLENKVLPSIQFLLGSSFVKKNDNYNALKWLEKAKKNGYHEVEDHILLAQLHIGMQHKENKNFAQALVWFQKGAHKDANSQFSIGELYATGKIAQKSGKNAIKWFNRVLENTNYPNFYFDSVHKAQLDIQANHHLGKIYLYGFGVSPDFPKAAKYFSEVNQADLYEDNTFAFYGLGCAYYEMQNFSEALKNFKIADQKGIPEASYNIGVMYSVGGTVPQNLKEALVWFEKSKVMGCEKATKAITAINSAIGSEAHTNKNYEEAIKYYKMAADDKDASASFIIATMHLLGQGTPKNKDEALKWYTKAKDYGHQKAQEEIDTLNHPTLMISRCPLM